MITSTSQNHQLEIGPEKSRDHGRFGPDADIAEHIERILHATLNVEEEGECFAADLAKLIPAERVSVLLQNIEAGTVTLAYTSGVKKTEYGQGEVFPFSGSLNEELTIRRSGFYASLSEPGLPYGPELYLSCLHREGLKSFLAAPLLYRDYVFGILLFACSEGDAYREDHVRFLEKIAGHVAQAIGNAQLFSGSREINEALEHYLSLLLATFNSTADAILVLDRAGNLSNYNQKFLSLWDIPESSASGMDNAHIRDHVARRLRDPHLLQERDPFSPDRPEEARSDVFDLSDGRKIECHSQPQRRANDIVGRVFSFRDITDLKNTEEALRRSEREARRLAAENAVMAEIGRIIGSRIRIEEVYDDFAREVKQILPFDTLTINIIDFDAKKVRMDYVSNMIRVPDGWDYYSFPLEGSVTERIIASKEGVILDAAGGNQKSAGYKTLQPAVGGGLRSALFVPLTAEGKVIATMTFFSKQASAYDQDNLRVGQRIGHYVAGAVANAQLFRERQQAQAAMRQSEEDARQLARENAVIAEISRIITSTPDVESVFDRFAEEARKIIAFDRMAINIVDPDSGTF
ncbi:MAG TPA: GAF domain-containing protein, partial [Thermodesulfobacteriota bacterium]|nr:GAF domain-containing protein [Thermodesulfobacteriota bacterium]